MFTAHERRVTSGMATWSRSPPGSTTDMPSVAEGSGGPCTGSAGSAMRAALVDLGMT